MRQTRTTAKVTDLLPTHCQSLIGPLAQLGKHDWLQRIGNNKLAVDERYTDSLWTMGFSGLDTYAWSVSRLLANGPKILLPTLEQCLALEQVNVRVSIEDYEQPFVAAVIEFPSRYQKILTERFCHDRCPRYALLHHDKHNGTIFIHYTYFPYPAQGERGITCTLINNCPTLDHSLMLGEDDEPDMLMAQTTNRVALNFCLLLTCHGSVFRGPLDPLALAKAKRAKTTNPKKLVRNRRIIEGMFSVVDLPQHVKFCKRTESHLDDGNADGPPVRPHWRRGHFRRQRFGPGRVKSKLVFIKPVFVNSDAYTGDLANTCYSIRG